MMRRRIGGLEPRTWLDWLGRKDATQMRIANMIAAFIYSLGVVSSIGLYVEAFLLTRDPQIDRQDRITAWLMVLSTLLLTFGLAFSIPWLAGTILNLS